MGFKSLRSWLLTQLVVNCSEKSREYSFDDVNVQMDLDGRKSCKVQFGKPLFPCSKETRPIPLLWSMRTQASHSRSEVVLVVLGATGGLWGRVFVCDRRMGKFQPGFSSMNMQVTGATGKLSGVWPPDLLPR